MATTTNFGWETPDDTDLVKDGAAAMRTLGSAIDTSFVDLKGGTTGQVLSKASNTDLDYTWVTQDDANAIQNAIVDAKGDLIAASAADTPARLAVGSDGSILQADSTAATGLRYTTLNPLPNPFTNSAFDIWQRGTSFTAGNYIYTADRWTFQRQAGSTGGTISRQTTSDTTNLPNIQYCARVQRDSGNTSTSFLQLINSMETANCIPFAGKTVTFSFYARAGANYSATSNLLTATLETGTGTDQNRASVSYTGSNTSITSNVTLTTTWQRFTVIGTIPTTATEFCAFFRFTPTGTAGANDYFEITGVAVDLGSSTAATLPTFARSSETIQGELAACQRYYERATAGNAYEVFAQGWATSTTNLRATYYYRIPKRVAATSLDFSTLRTSANTSVSAVSFDAAGIYSATVNATASTMVLNSFYTLLADNSTNAYLGFSAEL